MPAFYLLPTLVYLSSVRRPRRVLQRSTRPRRRQTKAPGLFRKQGSGNRKSQGPVNKLGPSKTDYRPADSILDWGKAGRKGKVPESLSPLPKPWISGRIVRERGGEPVLAG